MFHKSNDSHLPLCIHFLSSQELRLKIFPNKTRNGRGLLLSLCQRSFCKQDSLKANSFLVPANANLCLDYSF